jgi:DNA-binding transcriptional ArsR family regulator
MVKYGDAALDRTFAALSDPTRRALVARLAQEPDLSVSTLAEPFRVSLPAIIKHLDVLSDAGLVARTKSGRTVTCRLKAAPMQDAIAWLNRYERFWSEALSRLSDFLEEEESWQSTAPSNQASQSSGASKRPPPKSSRRGPTRKK